MAEAASGEVLITFVAEEVLGVFGSADLGDEANPGNVEQESSAIIVVVMLVVVAGFRREIPDPALGVAAVCDEYGEVRQETVGIGTRVRGVDPGRAAQKQSTEEENVAALGIHGDSRFGDVSITLGSFATAIVLIQAFAEVGQERTAQRSGCAVVGEVDELTTCQSHARPELRDAAHVLVALEKGKLSAGARLQLLIEDGEPTEAVAPIANAFGASSVLGKTAEEVRQALPREPEHSRQQRRVFDLGQGRSQHTLMTNRVPIVRRFRPVELVEIFDVVFPDVRAQPLANTRLKRRRNHVAKQIEHFRHEVGGLRAEKIDLHRFLAADVIVMPVDVRGQRPGNFLENGGELIEKGRGYGSDMRIIRSGHQQRCHGAPQSPTALKVDAFKCEPMPRGPEAGVELIGQGWQRLAALGQGPLTQRGDERGRDGFFPRSLPCLGANDRQQRLPGMAGK